MLFFYEVSSLEKTDGIWKMGILFSFSFKIEKKTKPEGVMVGSGGFCVISVKYLFKGLMVKDIGIYTKFKLYSVETCKTYIRTWVTLILCICFTYVHEYFQKKIIQDTLKNRPVGMLYLSHQV